jgi:hypothetical protein
MVKSPSRFRPKKRFRWWSPAAIVNYWQFLSSMRTPDINKPTIDTNVVIDFSCLTSRCIGRLTISSNINLTVRWENFLEIVQWRRVEGRCEMTASLSVYISVEAWDDSQGCRKLDVNVSTKQRTPMKKQQTERLRSCCRELLLLSMLWVGAVGAYLPSVVDSRQAQ